MTPSTTHVDSPLRPERLAPALVDATGDPRWRSFESTLIAGGKSNLTYLLTSEAGELVLRRPPSGDLLPTAHDMGREVRVQSALSGSDVPVPRIVLFEADGTTLGVPFYAMDRVPGHVIRGDLPPAYADSEADRARIADALIDTLATLHALDPAELGLSDFGRPDGFLERQLGRWTKQSQASRTAEVPALDQLAAALRTSVPATARGTVVHGDFRLDNCVMDPGDPGRVAAVLDWELSALGDPLADVGLLLCYWQEPGEPDLPLVTTVTSQGGFPVRLRRLLLQLPRALLHRSALLGGKRRTLLHFLRRRFLSCHVHAPPAGTRRVLRVGRSDHS